MSVKKVVKYGTPSLRQPSKEVHKVLSNNKRIKKYYLDNWNLGQTIVELKDNL